MQSETIKTVSSKFSNGDVILAVTGNSPNRALFIQTTDGVFEYSESEVQEIYGYIPHNLNIVGTQI